MYCIECGSKFLSAGNYCGVCGAERIKKTSHLETGNTGTIASELNEAATYKSLTVFNNKLSFNIKGKVYIAPFRTKTINKTFDSRNIELSFDRRRGVFHIK